MARRKSRWLRLLFLPIPLIGILVVVSAFLLWKTFSFGFENDIMPYISYFLSAYTLTVVCVGLPRMIQGIRRMKEENRYVHRYLTDVHLRTEVSLYLSVGVNVLYALLQLIAGVQNQSVWFYSLAGYYVLLAVVRFFLLSDTRHLEFGQDIVAEYRRYRFCGVVLLLVNLALAVIVTYIVWQNRGFVHHEIVTIAMAAYTFYSMTKAILNVLKYRRHESPILLASKSISLTAALVSLLALETAMLTAFGSGEDLLFRQIMTASTGGVICLLILAMAVYMIVRGTREIRLRTKGTKEYGTGK